MSLTFTDFDLAPDPGQIELIYRNGLRGALSDPAADQQLLATTETFYGAFPKSEGIGAGRLSAPYKAVLVLDKEFGSCEAQTTGDCVSHATRNAGMVDYCVDALFGETQYLGRFATENIYGGRGHGGQGASCSRLAEYISADGPSGFLVRQKYSAPSGDAVDLSVYRASIGAGWGRQGTPAWLNEIASANRADRVLRVTTLDEARDAIACGFGLSRCGWWGYQSRRNADGVCEVSGRWSHAMCVHGFDDSESAHKYRDGLACYQQSWGDWGTGPKRADQPNGSFWVPGYRLKAEIDAGGVYVIASIRGFDRDAALDLAEEVRNLSDS